ncbi:hypothetical protein [Streptomyces indiaensis]|nr:hypothetical protein [Streptomyces indiaensis]MCF1644594.1 hypothetical protein [Streptomyces indiaensis]
MVRTSSVRAVAEAAGQGMATPGAVCVRRPGPGQDRGCSDGAWRSALPIQQVTSFFGGRYVDLYSSSVGHDTCQPADIKWVEGICGDAADYWPAKLPGTLLNCGLTGKRVPLVHPNAEDHADTAAHVERAIRIALLHQ